LRAIRFFAIDGFSPVSELYAGAAATAHLIAGEPGERISMELSKILLSGRTSESMRMLINFGLMHYIFPDIEHLAGVTQQPEYYTEDALNHTFKVLSLSEPVLRLRLAALFHDVGKARTRQTREGKIVFSGHQYAGAEKTREALKRLRYPRKLVEEVSKLVEMHMIAYRTEWSDTAVRRLVHEAGDLLDDLLLLYRADILARAQPHNDLSIFEHLLERIKLLDLDSIIYAKSPLTGEMIMSVLGVAEGPLVGDAQDAIEQAIVDGKIGADESSAMQLLRKEIAPRLKGNSR
jgi:poly(A) polymerase